MGKRYLRIEMIVHILRAQITLFSVRSRSGGPFGFRLSSAQTRGRAVDRTVQVDRFTEPDSQRVSNGTPLRCEL